MTGRGAGYCAGYAVPGFMNSPGGPGPWGPGPWGGGRGGGRGWRHRFHATGLFGWQRAAVGAPAFGYPGAYPAGFGPVATEEHQLDALKAQAEYFRDALEGIKKRIGELECGAREEGQQ